MDSYIFGTKLFEIRVSNHLTQKEVAEAVGVSQATISHFEQFDKYPKKETIENIADYFGVPTDYFLNE